MLLYSPTGALLLDTDSSSGRLCRCVAYKVVSGILEIQWTISLSTVTVLGAVEQTAVGFRWEPTYATNISSEVQRYSYYV